ncbi:hypothetical protein [Sporosarcina newyorkensis]|uniref:Uncharacterized protein n=1 Tax=Sporosarcina newyorkensis TaxID=759851 RepID=A0A1T4YII9_9BACL|nr:hypothetical protein [Sporosarcina newyorkensis]SKB01368.1 hypothetical protein SAMN04244570_2704 [Sporosarcina newyorkensis]
MKKTLFAIIILVLGFSYTAPAGMASTAENSGLSPIDGLILTYSPSFNEPSKETFHVKKEETFTYLYNKKSQNYPELANLVYIEDDFGLSASLGYSDFVFVSAPYPLKQGSTFLQSDHFDDYKVLVENTAKTVKVKAGTFKNTVILKYPDGSRVYLAKGVGIIKITDAAGKVTTELAAVKAGK